MAITEPETSTHSPNTKPADYRFTPQTRRAFFTDGCEVSVRTNVDVGFMVKMVMYRHAVSV